MKIYRWADDDGEDNYYTAKKDAIGTLRWLQSEGETSTPVSSIECLDVITLLYELRDENKRLRQEIQKLGGKVD